jgi:hypothetical protein
MDRLLTHAAAAAVAVTVLFGFGAASQAIPLSTNAAGLQAAVPTHTVEVQYRRVRRAYVPRRIYYRRAYWPRRYYRARYYPRYWRYYYPAPAFVFAPFFLPPPVYVVPRRIYVAPGPYRRCWIKTDDRGFGYWGPC